MTIKLVEIRDRGTFIPAMAVALRARDEAEMFLLNRAGYGEDQIPAIDGNPPYVILVKLDGVEAQYDPFAWENQRTMGCAHRWISEHWRDVQPGSVIDVEFLLGETDAPKKSERLS